MPIELERAVDALARSVAAQLREELRDAGTDHERLAGELGRRREDYRTWYRMDEVPDRVAVIAARLVTGEPDAVTRKTLELAVLDALVRAHGEALSRRVSSR